MSRAATENNQIRAIQSRVSHRNVTQATLRIGPIPYIVQAMHSTRRQFLKQASIAGIGFLGLRQFASQPLMARDGPLPLGATGYGPLSNRVEDILALPKGFTMRVISRRGDAMDDGLLVPGMQDGMAAFPAGDGRVLLVCNHENEPDWAINSPFGKDNFRYRSINTRRLYDPRDGKQPCIGGTTNLLYNPATQRVEKSFLSLIGTERNCAGGPTPWGTWITCEESNQRNTDGFKQDHGYNFEVPATTRIGLTEPVPLKAMGRFRHEAIAVDPDSGIIFQSEDMADGCLYRFIPKIQGKPAEGGKLQALAIQGQYTRDTRNWSREVETFPVGQPFAARWVDLSDPESPKDDLRYQAQKKGAAIFARMEGMWTADKEIYFACTSGGPETWGQVFRYTPSPYEGQVAEKEAPGQLELFVEPNNSDLLRNCDNLTIAPWGDVILCEDASSTTNRLVGITPEGKLYHLAENILNSSEFAGACVSPDGKTLFVNIQRPGMTLAITGPWESRAS